MSARVLSARDSGTLHLVEMFDGVERRGHPLSLSRTNPPDSVRPAGCHQTRKQRKMGEIVQQPREEEIDYCPIGSCLR